MRLLDLFCCSGGCSMGYSLAGFTEIVGVDKDEKPEYPFAFVRGDALEYLAEHGREFDAIHSSPPCQHYTVARTIHNSGDRHPDLVGEVRRLLMATGKPYIIENVQGSPLVHPITLCGLMFDLKVIRHRKFESNILLWEPEHPRHPAHLRTGTQTAKRGGKGNGYSTGEQGLVCVAGNNFVREAGARAMDIDWITSRKDLAQAIPPAYTFFLGKQILVAIGGGT